MNQPLTRHHQLDQKQMLDLDALCIDCKNTDKNIVAIYKHLLSQNRLFPCNLLYYQEEKLVGFLSTFFFYEDACEIAIMVAPAWRRQGIATYMLNDILPRIDSQQIKKLIFSVPAELNNHRLPLQGFCYQSSEYQMLRQLPDPLLITNKELLVRPAVLADIPTLCVIDATCFTTPQPNMARRLEQLLHDSSYTLFVAEKEGEIIGKAHISWQQDSARLTDIAILPLFQRFGCGSALIAHCINYCLTTNHANIHLDVEVNNQDALRLYLRLGFIVDNAYDFWSIPIEMILNRAGYSPHSW